MCADLWSAPYSNYTPYSVVAVNEMPTGGRRTRAREGVVSVGWKSLPEYAIDSEAEGNCVIVRWRATGSEQAVRRGCPRVGGE